MENKENVALTFYSEAYESSIHSYTLPEEQLIYTALPAEAIAKCKQERDRTPVLILAENKLAGFFVLDAGEAVKEYTEGSGALLIRSYSIHPDYQGKGVGKKSLKLLPSFINHHFRTENKVVLGVNHKNTAAQHLYKRCGFVDTDRHVFGSQGKQFVYQMNIKKA
ncbi:GNAT family N-acetyltransferase [Priestia aryabhattai]|uniref:GNAT family N-acetyltransferase n=1 Tax=Priestia aryabhattai TaxID=412384 RepID=A0ABD7WSS2_PRIAR|nr:MULTISPECIES: GNAT family N-acetyltransferase [Priestia]MCL9636165.1 GNAT family N-acetyltransferase [Bacillus zanthoxyli]MBY0026317.1 GNAT family N-acetyltransferase [Priestia aryabhattai]MBY0075060.1 GNAT family N-acetyltransferase [Priestia aryabhattai]MEB4868013.1 GNAT family N-acetyltransferase [Priestia megaterium]MED3883071.1 GNAT family N-acetyltransferase [Priestia aryabhattai]